MSDFNQETLKDLEKLCHISCSKEAKQRLLGNLHKILDFVEKLDELKVNDENHPTRICDGKKTLRKDEIKSTLSNDNFLLNAPEQIGGMIKVPQVIENQE